MHTVSVIIPFLDEYSLLREAIASALAQRGVMTELIIVRNLTAPPDMAQLPPLPVNAKVLHQPIKGSGYARNTGLQAATGTWVQFLDVDDLLLPDKISHQLYHDDADVIVSPMRYQYPSGKKVKSAWLGDDIWSGLLNSGLGSASSMLWKREPLLTIGGWNTSIQSHQEYELLFRMLKSGFRVYAFDRIDTLVRGRDSGSITVTSRPVRNEEGIILREQIWSWLQQQDMATPERLDAFRQYIFKQLRGLYRKNRSAALEKYRTYFAGSRFAPKNMNVPAYGVLYRLLGFTWTENLIQALLRLRRIR